MDRVAKALALVDKSGLGIEIGPAHSPIAPKRDGYRVHVVDFLDAAGLREKFHDDEVTLDRIEEVDFVWSGGSLAELIGSRGTYDWIIASHVLEHVPDMVGLLADCEALLRPTGVLSLILPDKRYCFDHFRPLSTTGDLLDAHERRDWRASPGSVFEHLANSVTQSGRIAWASHDHDPFRLTHEFSTAEERWRQTCASDEYTDAHIWRFIPESFELIVDDLRRLGLLHLAVKQAFGSTGHEFHLTLGTDTTAAPSVDRLATLIRIKAALGRGPADNVVTEAPTTARQSGVALSPREEAMVLAKRRALAAARRGLRRLGRRLAFRREEETSQGGEVVGLPLPPEVDEDPPPVA